MILKSENMLKKINKNIIWKGRRFEIPLNWTVIRHNDVSGRRFESVMYE